MMRWLCACVVAAVLSGFAGLLLTGRYINDGPVLITLAATHGLHAGDLFVVAGWLAAMTALALLTTRQGRRHGG
ncbi:hypothetical protein [Blastococcus brunescens]|uniref:Uncharacterized protein n=1 Tax=Blastococcus brunescens TaxID=1564165 RepID=A0ABZ1B2I5_9ACTN|nr:hypothetical protein [Blastococcus sp. BMG 8361]WRL64371.1 hypothetical protein U6N30_00430 [Blastococcus sp. BMG 8361]